MYHAPSLSSFPKGRLTRRIENAPNPGMYRRSVVLFPASLWFGLVSAAMLGAVIWSAKKTQTATISKLFSHRLATGLELFTITSKLFNSVYIETQVMRSAGTLRKFLVFS